MNAGELMTAQPTCCTPEDTIQQAAQLMRDYDCGCIPVVENTESNRVVGLMALNHRAASDSEVGKVVERISEPALSPG